jgi:hypothetical protein
MATESSLEGNEYSFDFSRNFGTESLPSQQRNENARYNLLKFLAVV